MPGWVDSQGREAGHCPFQCAMLAKSILFSMRHLAGDLSLLDHSSRSISRERSRIQMGARVFGILLG